MARVYNFSAGPAVLPESVLQECADEMMDYRGSGMSVMEMSHRSKMYQAIVDEAEADLRTLMGIPANYHVLFLQGGAHQQFSAIPLNLCALPGAHRAADYINTGMWTKKALAEAKRFIDAAELASSADETFSYIPDCSDLPVRDEADYVYICENNTIYGTVYHELPNTKGKTLVSDVSSMFLSQPHDVERYGVIYGGVQKNVGPAGISITIVRDDLVPENDLADVPIMLQWRPQVEAGSMYNTPNCWAIYVCGKVFKWLLAQGGLAAMKERNVAKAQLLYDFLDESSMFRGTVRREDRSLMNVPFVTGDAELDAEFVKAAAAAGLENLKGHRSVGGMRASIYNAMPVEGVEALVSFMREFEAQH